MSVPQVTQPTPPPRRSGCATALLFLVGLALLLPGLCATLSAATMLPGMIVGAIRGFSGSQLVDPNAWLILGGWTVLWLACIGLGWAGVKLIIRASR